jgi:hypothetical protein
MADGGCDGAQTSARRPGSRQAPACNPVTSASTDSRPSWHRPRNAPAPHERRFGHGPRSHRSPSGSRRPHDRPRKPSLSIGPAFPVIRRPTPNIRGPRDSGCRECHGSGPTEPFGVVRRALAGHQKHQASTVSTAVSNDTDAPCPNQISRPAQTSDNPPTTSGITPGRMEVESECPSRQPAAASRGILIGPRYFGIHGIADQAASTKLRPPPTRVRSSGVVSATEPLCHPNRLNVDDTSTDVHGHFQTTHPTARVRSGA